MQPRGDARRTQGRAPGSRLGQVGVDKRRVRVQPRTHRRRGWRAFVGALAVAALLCLAGAGPAAAGPPLSHPVYAPGKLVPIPASIPHEPGDMVDRRIVPDLRWIAARFPVYVTDGYSGPLPGGRWAGCHGCHVERSDHYNGLAVDIVPLRWSDRCDASWRGITRLAHWAEPVQNRPLPPFRWVGYDGDAGHGCGNHLHLSWNHAPAARYRLAAWVEAFPAPLEGIAERRRRRRSPTPSRPSAPPGGISQSSPGGLGAGD